MSSIVNLRTGLGPVLSLFGAKDRWTSPLIKARTVPTLAGGPQERVAMPHSDHQLSLSRARSLMKEWQGG